MAKRKKVISEKKIISQTKIISQIDLYLWNKLIKAGVETNLNKEELKQVKETITYKKWKITMI